MKTLSQIGALVRVTPSDDIWITTAPGKSEYVNDPSPFFMQIDGLLEDGHIFYGVFGKVTGGHSRYQNLICSLITRMDRDDWRIQNKTYANFKVGIAPVRRHHEFDFKHPEGTVIDGYPIIGRFGEIVVI